MGVAVKGNKAEFWEQLLKKLLWWEFEPTAAASKSQNTASYKANKEDDLVWNKELGQVSLHAFTNSKKILVHPPWFGKCEIEISTLDLSIVYTLILIMKICREARVENSIQDPMSIMWGHAKMPTYPWAKD